MLKQNFKFFDFDFFLYHGIGWGLLFFKSGFKLLFVTW